MSSPSNVSIVNVGMVPETVAQPVYVVDVKVKLFAIVPWRSSTSFSHAR